MNTHDLEDLPVLRTRLDALAERPAPPSAVDVRAARRSGERVRLRRTVGRVSAAVAVVVAGLLCVTVLPTLLRPAAHPGQIGNPATTPMSGWQITPLMKGTDPYYLSFDFGWLPTGYTVQQQSSQFANEVAILNAWGPDIPLTGADSGNTFTPQYTVNIGRQTLGFSGYVFTGPTHSSTVEVDGKSVTLQTGPTRSVSLSESSGSQNGGPPPEDVTALLGVISWRTTGGYFAQMAAILPADTPDAVATITHVVQSLRVSAEPVPLPVYFRNLPPGLATLDERGPVTAPKGDEWGFSVSLGLDIPAMVNITVSPASLPTEPYSPEGEMCKVEKGLNICAYTDGGPLPPPLAKIGIRGLLNDIVGLGTNPSDWTTDVVR